MSSVAVLTLLGTMIALSAVPGPSDFAVVACALSTGLRKAALMIVGIIIADICFILLAIYGLSAMAMAFEPVFLVLKYVGAVYLLWLGIRTLRAAPTKANVTTMPATPQSAFGSFSSGFLITLGDPKAVLFYLSLFPAFVDLAHLNLTDTVTIMLIATLAIAGVKGAYAYLATHALGFFANNNYPHYINHVAGSVLIVTGGWLIYSTV